jgi:hypothetical protein
MQARTGPEKELASPSQPLIRPTTEEIRLLREIDVLFEQMALADEREALQADPQPDFDFGAQKLGVLAADVLD